MSISEERYDRAKFILSEVLNVVDIIPLDGKNIYGNALNYYLITIFPTACFDPKLCYPFMDKIKGGQASSGFLALPERLLK